MELTSTPSTLSCAECGEPIAGAGYLPATDADGGYDPVPGAAICDTCGFTAVGMQGCAPTVDEVVEPGRADVLLYMRRGADGLELVSVKE